MKKLLTILSLLISVVSFSQVRSTMPMGTKMNEVLMLGVLRADTGILVTKYLDTTTANLGYIKIRPGAFIRTAANKIFMRNDAANKWLELAFAADIVAAGGNANVGAGYRWLKPATQEIKTFFQGFAINIDSTTNTNGLTATVDTTSGGVASWVRLKKVVDSLGAAGGGITDVIFTNGLTESPTNTGKLGGTLTEFTTIFTNGFGLTLTGNQNNAGLTVVNAHATANGLTSSAVGGAGVQGSTSTGGYGVWGSSTSGLGGQFSVNPSSTNTIAEVLRIIRTSSGVVAAGEGGMVTFYNETSNTTQQLSNTISSVLTNVTTGATVSQLVFAGMNSAVATNILTLDGGGALQFNQYTTGNFNITDTSTYKPLVADGSGNVRKATFWYGGGGGGISDVIFTNGLTESPTNTGRLGGTLDASTTINTTSAFALTVTGSKSGSPTLWSLNTSTDGIGLYAGSGASGTAIEASGGTTGIRTYATTTGISASATVQPGWFVNTLTTNGVGTGLLLQRQPTTGANGDGITIDFGMLSTTNTAVGTGSIKNISTTLGSTTSTAQFAFYLSSGTTNASNQVMTISGSGRVQLNKYGVNTFTGSPAYDIGVDGSGNLVEFPVPSGGGGGYTLITQFVDESAWRVYYSNASGDMTPQALGTNGQVWTSTGTTSAPTWSTPADGSSTNELQTLSNAGTATTHTATLSNSGGSLQLVESGIITLTTTGTALDGIVTIGATEVDGSISNELQTYAHTGTTSYTNTLSNSGGSFTLQAAGTVTIAHTAGTVTITGTGLTSEVDGSVTNELQTLANTSNATTHTATLSNSGGSLQLAEGSGITLTTTGTTLDGIVTIAATDPSITNEVQTYSHTGTTSYTNTLSLTGGSFTLNAAGIVTISHSAGTVTITGTEVDGSVSNELQTLANTSDATSHTVTLSNSGGSFQLIEGANITLTTGGTAGAGTITIAATGAAGFTTEDAQDAVGLMINASLQYVDATPLLAVNDRDFGDLTTTGSGLTWTVDAAAITYAKIQNGTGLSVLGRAPNTAGVNADIIAANDFEVLRRSGTSIGFGAINLASTSAVTGDLPFSNIVQGAANTVVTNPTAALADFTTTALGANNLLGRGSTGNIAPITVGGILSFSGTVLSATEVDGSVSNELQTLASTSDATSHTVTLSNTGGSFKLVEGTNITLTTTGTGADGIITIAATGGAAFTTEDAQDAIGLMINASLQYVDATPLLAVNDRDFGDITTTGSGLTWTIDNNAVTFAKIVQGAANTVVTNPTNATANFTTTALAASNLLGRGSTGDIAPITVSGLTFVGTVLTATDGSATNELQTFANTSDATSHTLTLSNSGGTIQFVEGSNISITTTGTSSAGIVTIASTGGGVAIADNQVVVGTGASVEGTNSLTFDMTNGFGVYPDGVAEAGFLWHINLGSTVAYSSEPGAGIRFSNKFNSSGSYAGMGGLIVRKENGVDGEYGSYLLLSSRPNGGSIIQGLMLNSDQETILATGASIADVGDYKLQVITSATTEVGQVIRLASSGTGDFAQYQNSGGAVLSRSKANGALYLAATSGSASDPSLNVGSTGSVTAGLFGSGSTGIWSLGITANSGTYAADFGYYGLLFNLSTAYISFGHEGIFGTTNNITMQANVTGVVSFSTLSADDEVIINPIGGEGVAASVALDADQNDDATDRWKISSTTANDLTLTNNSTIWASLSSAGLLKLNTVVQDDAETKVLVWNSTDKEVQWRASTTLGGGSASRFGVSGEDATAAQDRAFVINDNSFSFNSTDNALSVFFSKASTSGDVDIALNAGTTNQVFMELARNSGVASGQIGFQGGTNQNAFWDFSLGQMNLLLETASVLKIANLDEATGTKTLRYDPTTDLVSYYDIPAGGAAAQKFGKAGEDATAAENRLFTLPSTYTFQLVKTSGTGNDILLSNESSTQKVEMTLHPQRWQGYAHTIDDATKAWIYADAAAGAPVVDFNTYSNTVGQGIHTIQTALTYSIGSVVSGSDGGTLAFLLKGLTEATGTKTLRYNPSSGAVTYHDIPAGGSGSPGGSNGDIQFNNSGAFGGFGDWNGTKMTLSGSTSSTTLDIGSLGFQAYSLNNAWIAENIYFNGTNWTNPATGAGGIFYFVGEEGQFRMFSSVTAGTNLTSQMGSAQFKVSASGVFAIGGQINQTVGSVSGASMSGDASGNITTSGKLGIHTAPSYDLHISATGAQMVLDYPSTNFLSLLAGGALSIFRYSTSKNFGIQAAATVSDGGTANYSSMSYGASRNTQFGDMAYNQADLGAQVGILPSTTTQTGLLIYGTEGGIAKFSLAADENDDVTDMWDFISTTANDLTISNNGTTHVTLTSAGVLKLNAVAQDDAETKVLVWNSSDKEVQWRASSTLGGGGSGITVGTTTVTGGTSTNVLYNNAGVVGEYPAATTATASSLVLRDANTNLFSNNSIEGYTTTTTASGTTVFTVSTTFNQFFTGTLNQTITLPLASTLTAGQSWNVVNGSSGNITVNSSGGNQVIILAPTTTAMITCLGNFGTSAASWFPIYNPLNSTSGKKVTFNNTFTFNGTDGTTMTLPTVSSTIPGYIENNISSNATWSPAGNGRDNYYDVTLQAANVTTVSAPTGTPANHNTLLIRVTSDGSARTITGWNAIYRGGTNLALPATTTISKTMYIKFIYNTTSSTWDLVSVLDGL